MCQPCVDHYQLRAGIIDEGWSIATVSILPGKSIDCPYCGEQIELIVDDSAGEQQYVEDCSVCCRPINVEVTLDDTNSIVLNCRSDNETW